MAVWLNFMQGPSHLVRVLHKFPHRTVSPWGDESDQPYDPTSDRYIQSLAFIAGVLMCVAIVTALALFIGTCV